MSYNENKNQHDIRIAESRINSLKINDPTNHSNINYWTMVRDDIRSKMSDDEYKSYLSTKNYVQTPEEAKVARNEAVEAMKHNKDRPSH